MKKQMVKSLGIIAVSCMLCSTCFASEDEVWLPDVNTVFGVEGEYYDTVTESNKITYDFYTYDFEGDSDTVGNYIVVYTEALKELDFKAKKLKDKTAVWYESYTKDDYTAELAIYVTDDADKIVDGGSGKWQAILAVPEGMSFELGNGAPGVRDGETVCEACDGSGKCAQCGGSGNTNYGAGREKCVVCKGSGKCKVCDGKGTY